MDNRLVLAVSLLFSLAAHAEGTCTFSGNAAREIFDRWMACEDCATEDVEAVLHDPGYASCLGEALMNAFESRTPDTPDEEEARRFYEEVAAYAARDRTDAGEALPLSGPEEYLGYGRSGYLNLVRQRALKALLGYPLDDVKGILATARDLLRKLPDSSGKSDLLLSIEQKLDATK